MNPMQRQMAQMMKESARKFMAGLDPASSFAKAIESFKPVEALMEQDIDRICEAVSLGEITQVFTLAARLKMAAPEKIEPLKDELKQMAQGLVTRVEKNSGKLHIPDSCRDFLLCL